MIEEKNRLEAKREEILAAASEVFREEGYDTASMDRVAERAGASKRTVYNHFGSKDALFEAVVTSLHEQKIAAKQIPWDMSRPLADQLRDFAKAKGAMVEDEASMALMRVVLGVAIRHPELIERFAARYTKQEDSLVLWLRQAHEAGALKVPDADLAAAVFWAMSGGALFWPVALGFDTDVAAREHLTTELVEVFLARYRAEH